VILLLALPFFEDIFLWSKTSFWYYDYNLLVMVYFIYFVLFFFVKGRYFGECGFICCDQHIFVHSHQFCFGRNVCVHNINIFPYSIWLDRYNVISHLKTITIIILGTVIFKEPISSWKVVGIILAVVGIVLYTVKKKSEGDIKERNR
jgi:drug/metabolite transporter (DMT)-like permease